MKWGYKWGEHYINYPFFIKNYSKQPVNSLSALIMSIWVYKNNHSDIIEQKIIIFNLISSFFAHSIYHPMMIFLDNESMTSAVIAYIYNRINKNTSYFISLLYCYMFYKKVDFDTRFGIITGIPVITLLQNNIINKNDIIYLLLGCVFHFIDKKYSHTHIKYLYLHALWHVMGTWSFSNIINKTYIKH